MLILLITITTLLIAMNLHVRPQDAISTPLSYEL